MSSAATRTFLALCLAIITLTLYRWLKHKRANPKGLPFPPGPKPLPLIGNVRDVPTSHEWLTYSEWAKEYGDIVHIKVFGQHIVLLNSLEVTTDIFEKRSSIYSDRPRMPMINELMGWDWAFAFMPYGSWWRQHRKAFHQLFHQGASEEYMPSQALEIHKMLNRLLDEPAEFSAHIRHTGGAIIMRVVYGIEVRDSDDPYINTAEEVMASVSAAGLPGAFLVNALPFLKNIPAWLPGAGFRRKARRWHKLTREDFVDKPFNFVRRAMASGTARPSISAKLLEGANSGTNLVEDEKIAKNVAAIAYAGASDTNVAVLQFFFLAMLLYPDVQKKAQAELDAVVGNARLPDFSDRPELPYIEAILKETLRWQPAVPLAVPHRATADGEYNGYYIPKDAIVIGNAWSILHDETAYPAPQEFRPERFLKDGKINPDVRDPDVASFGFGRRTCPGRHFGLNSVFITAASVLAAFDIAPTPDSPVEAEVTSGMFSYPKPFRCTIKPRSSRAAELIRQSLESGDSNN